MSAREYEPQSLRVDQTGDRHELTPVSTPGWVTRMVERLLPAFERLYYLGHDNERRIIDLEHRLQIVEHHDTEMEQRHDN